jgi:hypothetical protein
MDGSPDSVTAVRRAVAEARYRHADLDIITCWYPPLVAEASGYQAGFLDVDDCAARDVGSLAPRSPPSPLRWMRRAPRVGQ